MTTVMMQRPAAPPSPLEDAMGPIGATGAVHLYAVRSTLVGARRSPRSLGEDRVACVTNYFKGSDASRWHARIPNYQRVRFIGVYPGIDLVYYGKGSQLEFDFIVHPGADPRRIRIRHEGSDEPVALTDNGALSVATTLGRLLTTQPIVHQSQSGESPERAVTAAWRLEPSGEASLAIGSYDRSRALEVDPIVFSTLLGGSGGDASNMNPNSGAIDSAGNIFVTAITASVDFPTTVGAFDRTLDGLGDASVSKLDPSGSTLLYSTYLGGDAGSSEATPGVVVDADGNAYVSGGTSAPDFPTTPGAFMRTLAGSSDCFVTKLDPTGSTLVYSTYLGGSGTEAFAGEALDPAGQLWTAIQTSSGDFPTTTGCYSSVAGPGAIARLAADGTGLSYASYFPAPLVSAVSAGVDSLWLLARYSGGSPPVTPSAFRGSPIGGVDVYFALLRLSDSAVLYGSYFGGSGTDESFTGLALDNLGNVYFGGRTISGDLPATPGVYDPTPNGGDDGFIAKFSPDGSTLLYCTYLGGAGLDRVLFGFGITSTRHAVIGGRTTSSNFPIAGNFIQDTYGLNEDGFVSELSEDGSQLVFSTYLGSIDDENVRWVTVGPGDMVYAAGYASGVHFPTTPGAFDQTFNGGRDLFVVELNTASRGTSSIAGKCFNDMNANGVWDPDEPPFPGRLVHLEPAGGYLFTKEDGSFSFSSLATGSYRLSFAQDSLWAQSAPVDIAGYVIALGDDQALSGYVFGGRPTHDVCSARVVVKLVCPNVLKVGPRCMPCCDVPNSYHVFLENTGTTFLSGQLDIQLPPEATNVVVNAVGPCYFDSQMHAHTCNTPPVVIGNSIAIRFNPNGTSTEGIPPGRAVDVELTFTPVCQSGSVPTLVVGASYHDRFCPLTANGVHAERALCAHDPNAKSPAPPGCGVDGLIAAVQPLRYLVEFHNTGTAPADLVVVRDTLDADLDSNTVVTLGSSHPQVFERHGRVLAWSFWGIELPDSIANEPASHGYVEYAVRPRADVPVGAVIENTASIYFDRNDPVVTNRTHHTITDQPVPISGFTASSDTVTEGGEVSFSYTGGTPNATYSWMFGPGAIPETSTEANPTVRFDQPGAHLAILSVALGDCESTPELKRIDVYGRGTLDVPARHATRLSFYGGMPNPFSRSTELIFDLPTQAPVWLEVFDVGGRRVASILSGEELTSGTHRVPWNGSVAGGGLARSGVYYARLRVGTELLKMRIVLSR
ncbi:MAG TPA: SdrD B-like domain-containing protein [Candidatus Eisenbacteria bacterium]